MIGAFPLCEQEPDGGRCEQHAGLCRRLPGAASSRELRQAGKDAMEPAIPFQGHLAELA